MDRESARNGKRVGHLRDRVLCLQVGRFSRGGLEWRIGRSFNKRSEKRRKKECMMMDVCTGFPCPW